jgi:hypothetical protein
MKKNAKTESYLDLNTASLTKGDAEYLMMMDTNLRDVWNRLNVPEGKSSFKSEVDFLNARLILLFFDNQFRKDLRALAHMISGLSKETIKGRNLKKANLLEPIEGVINPSIDDLNAAVYKLAGNWAVSIKIDESSITLSPEEYAPHCFNLQEHNKKLYLILKDAPNTQLKFIEEIGYEDPSVLYLRIDNRYSVEVNLRKIESTLLRIFSKRPMNIDTERYFRPKNPSYIFQRQTRHVHFEFHITGMKTSLESPTITKYQIAKISTNKLTTTGPKNSIKEDDLKTIMTNLSQITRAFHPRLVAKNMLIYVDCQEIPGSQTN